MYRKGITEFIIYKNLRSIQEHPVLNETISLYLDTYTQVLDVFGSTNNEVVNQAVIPIEDKAQQIEMIIAKQVIKIQDNPSIKISNRFHAKACYDILVAVHSTNKELTDKLWLLKQESFDTNLNDLYINNTQ